MLAVLDSIVATSMRTNSASVLFGLRRKACSASRAARFKSDVTKSAFAAERASVDSGNVEVRGGRETCGAFGVVLMLACGRATAVS